ncbi:MAG TPA: DUF2252 family protein [Vicinamibacteria bacterium]|nr:DUF2252 family protein [Vicinamibacteria bacterium]
MAPARAQAREHGVSRVAATTGEAAALDPAPLVIPANAPELQRNRALRERLEASPHSYFRGIGPRFMTLLCERYAERVAGLPSVILHGDAHLEQYAVTDHGRGLTDFDDSTEGSALIDLARFATSVQLAVRERAFTEGSSLIATFLRGYARALENPRGVAPEPALVRELRRGFEHDRLACLTRAEALMTPFPPDKAPSPETLERVASVLAVAAGRPVSFFRVKKLGTLGIGIGSAADERYLLRIDGPSSKEKDDVILELKEVRSLPEISCLRGEQGPTRITVAQATLAYEPFSYVGYLEDKERLGRGFWFHAWPDNYVELRVASVPSSQALQEIVYDVGVQLGRGHARPRKRSDAGTVRKALAAALPKLDLVGLSAELADASEEAWRRFRQQSRPSPAP